MSRKMKVKVSYLGVLRNFTGKAEEEINLEKKSNLLDLIKLLSQKNMVIAFQMNSSMQIKSNLKQGMAQF